MYIATMLLANQLKMPMAQFDGPFTGEEVRRLQHFADEEGKKLYGSVPAGGVQGHNTWMFRKSADEGGFPYYVRRLSWQTGPRGCLSMDSLTAFVEAYLDPSLPRVPADKLPLSFEAMSLPKAELEPGKVYRLRRDCYGGYNHAPDYDEGRFIHVKVLEQADGNGIYKCTTRGEDGQHLGPGGGWDAEYEQKHGCFFTADQLEPLPS